jgi:anaerobic magnesium-protoporphyrin IX monomethyl ester cyclase
MAKVLLINPHYFEDIFRRSRVRVAISPGITPLGLLSIAAPIRVAGHSVKLLDLNLSGSPQEELHETLRNFKPDLVGATATTPLIKKVHRIAETVKKYDKAILVVAGGPHPSARPDQVLEESEIDFVVQGQGEPAISSIVEAGKSVGISNVYYKENGAVIKPERNEVVQDLDALPYPAYDLLDISRYRQPRIISREEPVGYIETSRGCYAKCIYCNKNIHGSVIRSKSPARTVDEMEWMLRLGFREIQIIDDNFTANKQRAHAVCDEILRRGLKFAWYPRGGIRVDRVDLELLGIMKRAGCYRIPFGVESGSQRVLDTIGKGIILDQVEKSVNLAKKVGMETECYFILGLPSETEDDLRRTIDFAVKLDPDYVKFPFMVPLPGTPAFDYLQASGRLKTLDWEKYSFYTSPEELSDHDVLPWGIIKRYERLAYRKFYFRPRFVFRTLLRTIRNRTFLEHAKGFCSIKW